MVQKSTIKAYVFGLFQSIGHMVFNLFGPLDSVYGTSPLEQSTLHKFYVSTENAVFQSEILVNYVFLISQIGPSKNKSRMDLKNVRKVL